MREAWIDSNICLEREKICLAQSNDEDAMIYLLTKYKPLVRRCALGYYLPDGDEQDLVQEGMIGLFKAIRDYNLSFSTSFCSFAGLCIKRQIQTAIKRSTRNYNQLLNKAVSLDSDLLGDNRKTIMDCIPDYDTPENQFEKKEKLQSIQEKVGSSLSKLERDVLFCRLEGHSFHEIAAILGHTDKTIDNAAFRMRRKLKQLNMQAID